jgi:hypothetical protein
LEEELSTLALNAFHCVDKWQTQLAPLLEAASQEILTVQTPSSHSEPYNAFEHPFTQVNTPAFDDKNGHQSDQSVFISASSKESQLPHQDFYSSYPSPASLHVSVTLDVSVIIPTSAEFQP